MRRHSVEPPPLWINIESIFLARFPMSDFFSVKWAAVDEYNQMGYSLNFYVLQGKADFILMEPMISVCNQSMCKNCRPN